MRFSFVLANMDAEAEDLFEVVVGASNDFTSLISADEFSSALLLPATGSLSLMVSSTTSGGDSFSSGISLPFRPSRDTAEATLDCVLHSSFALTKMDEESCLEDLLELPVLLDTLDDELLLSRLLTRLALELADPWARFGGSASS